MISIKFEYDSDTEIANYAVLKDKKLCDKDYVFELKLSFAQATALSHFLNQIMNFSNSNGYSDLLNKLDKFVNDHYKM
jgi:hypothetical protein